MTFINQIRKYMNEVDLLIQYCNEITHPKWVRYYERIFVVGKERHRLGVIILLAIIYAVGFIHYNSNGMDLISWVVVMTPTGYIFAAVLFGLFHHWHMGFTLKNLARREWYTKKDFNDRVNWIQRNMKIHNITIKYN